MPGPNPCQIFANVSGGRSRVSMDQPSEELRLEIAEALDKCVCGTALVDEDALARALVRRYKLMKC